MPKHRDNCYEMIVLLVQTRCVAFRVQRTGGGKPTHTFKNDSLSIDDTTLLVDSMTQNAPNTVPYNSLPMKRATGCKHINVNRSHKMHKAIEIGMTDNPRHSNSNTTGVCRIAAIVWRPQKSEAVQIPVSPDTS